MNKSSLHLDVMIGTDDLEVTGFTEDGRAVPADPRRRVAGVTARLVGINHVAIEVGDIDEALEFYGRAFELTLRGRGRHMAFIDIGDQFIALEAARTQPPDAGRHIGIVVDDRDAALRALVEAGAERAGRQRRPRPVGQPRSSSSTTATCSSRRRPGCSRPWASSDLEKSERALEELRSKGLAHLADRRPVGRARP